MIIWTKEILRLHEEEVKMSLITSNQTSAEAFIR